MGGPFNGQAGRRQIFEALARVTNFAAFVETGCYSGATAEYLATKTSVPVYTVEPADRYFHYSRWRLRRFPNVHLHQADSRDFLRKLASKNALPKGRLFFYLDAHWNEDLPLAEEVETIATNWSDVVIMIDDFEVPDDPCYGFDDYGIGKRICLDYLDDLRSYGLVPFFPSMPSDQETGMKRGSIVLVSESLEAVVAGLDSLRCATS